MMKGKARKEEREMSGMAFIRQSGRRQAHAYKP